MAIFFTIPFLIYCKKYYLFNFPKKQLIIEKLIEIYFLMFGSKGFESEKIQ